MRIYYIFYEHFSVCIVSSKTQFLSNQIVLAGKPARQKKSKRLAWNCVIVHISLLESERMRK